MESTVRGGCPTGTGTCATTRGLAPAPEPSLAPVSVRGISIGGGATAGGGPGWASTTSTGAGWGFTASDAGCGVFVEVLTVEPPRMRDGALDTGSGTCAFATAARMSFRWGTC